MGGQIGQNPSGAGVLQQVTQNMPSGSGIGGNPVTVYGQQLTSNSAATPKGTLEFFGGYSTNPGAAAALTPPVSMEKPTVVPKVSFRSLRAEPQEKL